MFICAGRCFAQGETYAIQKINVQNKCISVTTYPKHIGTAGNKFIFNDQKISILIHSSKGHFTPAKWLILLFGKFQLCNFQYFFHDRRNERAERSVDQKKK